MSKQQAAASAAKPRTGWSGFWGALPRWKQVLLAVATLLIATGGVLAVIEATQPAAPPGGTTGPGGPATGFVPGFPGGQPGSTGHGSGEEPVSAGFFRLGFSFVAGFCIGYAVRKTLKLAALLTGLLLICLFLLSYFGLIEVKWHDIDQLFERFMRSVETESERFRTFVTGSLPAAGLAALGLVAGFKKS